MVKLKKQKVRPRKKLVFPKSTPHFKSVVKFLILLLVLAGIGASLARIKYMFIDSDYFMVKTIDVKLHGEDALLRSFSLGEVTDEVTSTRNIFFIDLDTLKEKMEVSHREFKDIVVRRLLPNKLVVYANLRNAIAQIRSDRYYLVDKEGVLLPDVKNFPDPDLPIIAGIGINLAKVPSVSNFTKFEREKLDRALGLIKDIDSIEGLSRHRLKMVDVTDPGNVSFFLVESNIEIKIGYTDFHDRLLVLVTVLEQLGSDIDEFKYIDLRFEDPIIGPQ